MNNNERTMWIQNDENLYTWFRSSRMSMTKFIKENKIELDQCIDRAMNPKQNIRTW